MAELSARLEAVFGARASELDASHIQVLVDSAVSEDSDLDFKSELYGHGDSARRDLAGDVAALANTVGGALIIGVGENQQARAATTSEVVLSDAEIRRMRLIIASNVAPVPAVDIRPIPASAVDKGYYLLIVPRSRSSPHGVLVNEALRYPVRHGTTTRHLSEAEVAAAYRERFRGEALQAERAAERIANGIAHLARDRTWLAITLVPEQPGALQISQAAFTTFQTWAAINAILGLNDTFYRYRVGAHRFIADGGSEGGPAEYVLLETYTDGSGMFAYQLSGDDGSLTAERASQVGSEALAVGVLGGLRLLAEHARDRAHANGTALVRAQVVASAAAEAVLIDAGSARRPGRHLPTPIADLESVELSAAIEDLMAPGHELPQIAASIVHQLGQQFGVPELAVLRRDGAVNPIAWDNTYLAYLRRWAERVGVVLE